jgi:hypothetical protein
MDFDMVDSTNGLLSKGRSIPMLAPNHNPATSPMSIPDINVLIAWSVPPRTEKPIFPPKIFLPVCR